MEGKDGKMITISLMIEKLTEHYGTIAKLAEKLGCSASRLYQLRRTKGLIKETEIIKRIARLHQEQLENITIEIVDGEVSDGKLRKSIMLTRPDSEPSGFVMEEGPTLEPMQIRTVTRTPEQWKKYKDTTSSPYKRPSIWSRLRQAVASFIKRMAK